MKKSYLVMSALVLSMGLVACGKKEEAPAPAPVEQAAPAAEAPAPAAEAPAAEAPAADTAAPADAAAPAEAPAEQPK